MGNLADEIGQAARASRQDEELPLEYVISDKVDQMVLLHAVLVELRKITVKLGRPMEQSGEMDEIPITCEQAYERANSFCNSIGPEGVTHYAPNGEPYVNLVAGGIKAEGEEFPEWFLTENAALAAWHESFWKYWREQKEFGKPCIIYWRTRPEVMRHPNGADFTIYSRLLIA